MNKSEFMEGIHILQNNYNQTFSKDKLRLYYENLKDMEKEEYLHHINELIKIKTYLPNIAEIRGDMPKNFANYEQRNYKTIDFDSLYAN